MSRDFTEEREVDNSRTSPATRTSEDANREISAYREIPASSGEEPESNKAHELFALFTANIIKENKVFTR